MSALPSADAPTGRLLLEEASAQRSVLGWAMLCASCLATAWLALCGGLLLWSAAPVVKGWQPRLVLSGSMEPHLAPGDVVLISPVHEPRALVPGQVIAVEAPALPSGNYLHRLVRHDPDGRLVTRGDANATEDFPPVSGHQVLGEARLLIPMVGRPLLWSMQGNPAPLVAVLLATATAIALVAWQAGVPSVAEPRHRPAILRRPAIQARGRRADHVLWAGPSPSHRRVVAAVIQGAAASVGVVTLTGLATWIPIGPPPGADAGSGARLVTLNRFLPTGVMTTSRPDSTCTISWTPARDSPPTLTYDVLNASGEVVATGVPPAAGAVVAAAGPQTYAVRARVGTWTSAATREAPRPCTGTATGRGTAMADGGTPPS